MNGDLATPKGQTKPWMIAAVLGGIVAAYLLLWFLPQQRQIQQLRETLAAHQQHVLKQKQLSQLLAETQAKLDEHREVTSSWQASAPTRDSLGKLFAELSRAAEATGVKFTRFDPSHRETHQLLEEHDIVLAFQGTFAAAHDFVHRVEKLPETVWVRQLQLSSGPPSEPLQGELTLTIFAHRGVNSDQVDFNEPIEKEGEGSLAER